MEKYQVKGMSCEILFGFFIDEFNGSRGECQS